MAAIAGGMLALPALQDADAERHEAVHAAHRVQDLLLARAGRRIVS